MSIITPSIKKLKRREKGVKTIDKRSAVILFSVVAVAALLSGVALTVYAADNEEEAPVMPVFREWRRAVRGRWGLGGGCVGRLEVSDDYEANVMAIAESDADVQELLASGYSIVGVRPIVTSIVDADGDVVTRASSAIVLLAKEDATGHAWARVDLDAGKVTKIVIVSRTVIDKT